MGADERQARPSAEAFHAEGMKLMAFGKLAMARRCFLLALQQNPDFTRAKVHLSLACLAAGDFETGWRLFEARPTPYKPDGVPEWQGEPLAGRHVLVCGEQGFGDQIMFARYVPRLQSLAGRVTFGCSPEVAPLFPGAMDSVPRRFDADLWVRLCSLPLRLGLRAPPPPWLPSVHAVDGRGVGVMPSGRPEFWNDRHRTLPEPETKRLLGFGRDLRPEATGARDFLETARIVAELELVISVDTAVAHLAASMGKPTWILIPAIGTDWRWGYGTDRSAWYPSARLIRQPGPERWAEALDVVEQALDAGWRTRHDSNV